MPISDLVFVVLDGKHRNFTISTIKFDKFGKETGNPIINCSEWVNGFRQAKSHGYKYGLFLSSGTIFTDLDAFLKLLENYPHKGLIGHITDPLNATRPYFLHPQAFLLELDKFKDTDFEISDFEMPVPIRSEKNIHSNYTPLWLSPSKTVKTYVGKEFGEKLISRQLSNGDIVVNWDRHLREFKQYLHTQEMVDNFLTGQNEYLDIATNQLWVFNNEPFSIKNKKSHLVCPASGLYWIFHLIGVDVTTIDLVDISQVQLKFARDLLEKWDGHNYGSFVFEFIKQNKIKHYNLERPNITKLERVKLLKPSTFIDTVNNVFGEQCRMHGIDDFAVRWNLHKTKTVNFINSDIINFLKTHTGDFDIWMSNIVDYKYTLLHHTMEELSEYNTKNK
jgi:hypothetical protein